MVIDAAGFIFLTIVCVGVPYLAFKSNRRLGAGRLPMSSRRFFVQVILAQLYLFGLALFAAWRNEIDLLAAPPSPLFAWSVAAVFLAVLLGVMRWRWPQRDRESKERLYRLLPHQRGDYPLYFAVCLAAGICEETVYRRVTAVLLLRLTDNFVAAIFISATVFAIAHVVQGWRSVIAIFGIALMAHSVLLMTQSLYPVMAVHALYDALAGVLMSRWYERELESTPPVLSQSTSMR